MPTCSGGLRPPATFFYPRLVKPRLYDMDLLILILITIIVAIVVAFIVLAVRTFLKSPKGGTSDIDSSGTYDPGGWTATDYASTTEASDTTPDSGDAFGGGEDFSGGGSGGSWGDSGDSGGDSGDSGGDSGGGGNGGNGGGGE